MKFRITGIVSLVFLIFIAPAARAEVKTEERTRVQFPGMLGGFMKVFGGKSAKEGVVEKIAVKGDRKMTTNEDTAQLVDLAEEKVYEIDLKKKTYTVLTFAEMKRQMEEAMAKAKEEAAKNPAPKPDPKQASNQKPDFVVDVKVSESGQKKTINGFDCREVVMNITVRQKDKTAQDGSMVMTSSIWLTQRIAAMKELEDFDRRFAQKMVLPFATEMAQQIAPAMAAYPGLTEAMGKMEIEKVNMNGTAVMTVVRAEVAAPPDAASNTSSAPKAAPAEQNKQSTIPTSIGGLLGGLGKKAAPKPEESDANKPGTLMSTTNELVSVSSAVTAADVSIPAGFKEKK